LKSAEQICVRMTEEMYLFGAKPKEKTRVDFMRVRRTAKATISFIMLSLSVCIDQLDAL
jgi:hypothetical protein